MGSIPSISSSVLLDSALNFYRQEGYCLVERILSLPECRQYLDLVESIACTQETKYTPLMNPDRRFPEFRRLLCHPKVVRCLETLQQSKIVALQSMLYYKAPGSLGRDLHQDCFYAQSEHGAYIGTWFPLEDTDRENGGLVVYPGSHREPLLEVNEDEERKKTNRGDFMNDRGVSCIVPPGYSKKYLSVKAGSVVFIHGNLVHGSEENLSKTRFRRAFAAHYIKEGYPFVTGTHAKRQITDVYS